MAKTLTSFRCVECGAASPRWVGRCVSCGEWNSVVEEVPAARAVRRARPVRIAEISADGFGCQPTGVVELDRVLGGGLVRGSVTLLGGEPGIGKSTLVLQALGALAAAGHRCLAVSAEESSHQVRQRADRLGVVAPNLWLLAESSMPAIVGAVEEIAPDFLAVDSIQTVYEPDTGGPPGSVSQVRDCAHQLVGMAKASAMACVLVGHVTKEGSLAGPRELEHLVDTVLSFEGDRHHALRLLRAVKHRFGSTNEVGVFELAEGGLIDVPDPSGLFLGDRRPGVAGSAVVPTIEGHRPLVVELQALVVPGAREAGSPIPTRRTVQGLDQRRVELLLAVLQRRAWLPLATADVHVGAVGGVRVVEPGADLALALAVASSLESRALPAELVACGELGLSGEVRQVSHLGRRMSEAARLGFRRAVVPHSAPDPPPGLELVRVGTIGEALDAVRLGSVRELRSNVNGRKGSGTARSVGARRAGAAPA